MGAIKIVKARFERRSGVSAVNLDGIIWGNVDSDGTIDYKTVASSVRRRCRWDFQKKNPTVPKVMAGESHSGRRIPKLSHTIIIPRKRIEYIAPFFKYIYFLILSILPSVSWRTTRAPKPLPMRMRGTERVKANAPRTPSIEKIASITSR